MFAVHVAALDLSDIYPVYCSFSEHLVPLFYQCIELVSFLHQTAFRCLEHTCSSVVYCCIFSCIAKRFCFVYLINCVSIQIDS